MEENKKENKALGILGALLGALLGGGAIILLGQMGVISALSGTVLAYATLKGYEKLSGKLSNFGLVVSIVLMLITPYLADRVSWAIEIVQVFEGMDFMTAFLAVPEVTMQEEIQSAYWSDILFIYAFTAIGGFVVIRQTFKERKKEQEALVCEESI